MINRNEKLAGAKLELKLVGKNYGDIEKRLIDFDFEESSFKFNVSFVKCDEPS